MHELRGGVTHDFRPAVDVQLDEFLLKAAQRVSPVLPSHKTPDPVAQPGFGLQLDHMVPWSEDRPAMRATHIWWCGWQICQRKKKFCIKCHLLSGTAVYFVRVNWTADGEAKKERKTFPIWSGVSQFSKRKEKIKTEK